MSIMDRIIVHLTKGRTLFLYAFWSAVVMTIIRVLFSQHIYRDSANVYTYMVREFCNGNYENVIHPGIPFLNVTLSIPLTMIGFSPLASTLLVSCLFFIASTYFVYKLLEEFVPEQWAAFGTLLYVYCPRILRFSLTGLLDSSRLMFLVATMYFLCKLIRENYKSWRYAILFGCSLGGMTLARSEGIGNAVVCFGCFGIFWLIALLQHKKPGILPIFTSFFIWIAISASRILVNWYFCGEAIFDRRIHYGVMRFWSKITGIQQIIPHTFTKRDPLTIMDLCNQSIRGTYELYFIFIVIGLLLVCFSRNFLKRCWVDENIPAFAKWDNRYWIFLIFIFTHMTIIYSAGFSPYRYFIGNTPLLMPFLLIACALLAGWIVKIKQWKVWFPICMICLFSIQFYSGIHPIFSKKCKFQHQTGRLIGQMLKNEPEARVLSVDCSVEWYFSGTKRALPVEVRYKKGFQDFDYALLKHKDDTLNVKEYNNLERVPLPKWATVRMYRKVK